MKIDSVVLHRLISAGENARVEFKRSFDAAAIESVCAFANTDGGVVIVGVADDGRVVGATVGKETLKDWINQVRMSTAPSLSPDMSVHELDGRTVVAVDVAEVPIKPAACRGRYYRRSLNANVQMSIAEVVEQHLHSMNSSWDYQLDSRHGIDHVSLEKVSRFLALTNGGKGNADGPMEALRKFELLRDGAITFGCYLLFVKEESMFTVVEMGRFQTETIIKDSQRTKADLFQQVDDMLAFINKHMNRRLVITGKPQHDEVWDYPEEAVREAVINSIIHRDYRSASDTIVKVFDDRIELYNPGRLPPGLTMDDLLSGNYVSRPRNRQIVMMFKEAGIIEKYGSGIKRIRVAMEQGGCPEPKFEEIGDGFRVTLHAVTPQITPQITPQKWSLSERILDAVVEDPTITRAGIAQRLGVSAETVKEYLEKLKKQGVLKRVGPDRGGVWRVKREMRS